MIILGIETSCDETGLALIETTGSEENLKVEILGHELISQAKIHEQYGGVFPVVAKREHGRNLIPLLLKVLNSGITNYQLTSSKEVPTLPTYKLTNLQTILARENELLEPFLKELLHLNKPPIDKIAVTTGPGLEPALWAGISFAKALSALWDIPLVPVNHMEGHIFAALMHSKDVNYELQITNYELKNENQEKIRNSKFVIHNLTFPALALLISGGHTELVLMKKWREYEIIGATRDDAVGEAFDKVARILGLPYPGGPQISALAEKLRIKNYELGIKDEGKIHNSKFVINNSFRLPRPMIHSKDFDFSFSGLKTAVLYMVKEIPDLTPEIKQEIAKEFEDAVTEVLIAKTAKAIEEHGVETLILGGGVVANKHIREAFVALTKETGISLYLPTTELSTDNALMIALTGAFAPIIEDPTHIKAEGNLKLGQETKNSA